MTDQELLLLNQEGFIPGPGEEEGDFLKRVEEGKKRFFELEGEWIPKAHWDWVSLHLKEMFDFTPCYLPAFYSNKNLAPWHGAASWILGRAVSAIQLREGLRKGSYLGLYKREEILGHEAVHAARSGFEESKNEEFFAYMTSEKKWRRVLGPILQRPIEAWPFVVGICVGMIGEIGAMGILAGIGYWTVAIWTGLGFGRLCWRHWRLRRSAEQILKQVGDARLVRAILMRLTDEEIKRFSKGERVEEYALRQNCLRWRLIRLAYLRRLCGSESIG